MFKNLSIILKKRRRKRPIKRDEDTHSLRQGAFAFFDEGYRPAQIYKQLLVPASQKTLFRYFEDWKKKNHRLSYHITKKEMKKNPEFTEQMIKSLSDHLEMPVKEVVMRMQRPWGLKQALRGEWPNYGLEREQSEIERRLEAALSFLHFAALFHNSPRELTELLLQIITLKENAKLEVIRTQGQLIVTKAGKRKLTTIKLVY